MDSYVKCYYCKNNLSDPLELVCRHSFCSNCLTKHIQNNKINCPICGTEHTTPASSLSSAKPDTLVPYLIGLNSGAPYSVITDTSPGTIQAECSACKKMTDLRICYHCEKPLCAECRTKHHDAQKKQVDQSVHGLGTRTNEMTLLAQALNTSRNNRIHEYKTMKEQISVHVKDLNKKMLDEEQDLQKQLDARIQLETEKIAVTERELEYLQTNKSALDQVEDKYRQQSNQMVLLKMHKEYLKAAPVWKEKLDKQAGRLDVKKEEELHYNPKNTAKGDPLVATLSNSKKVNIHASPKDQTQSRACTIL